MKKHVWRCMLGIVLILAAATAAQAWTAAGRFVDNGNGTVSDTVTSLMWQQQDDGTVRTWVNALAYCEGLSLGGHSDWRLPNIKELSSIVDDGGPRPSIDTTAFPGTMAFYYWSSSTSAYDTSYAWAVFFEIGHVVKNYKADYAFSFARCVRP